MWESDKTIAQTPNSAIIQLNVDENFVINNKPTQGILDITAGGIFHYKSPNQVFQLLEDKIFLNLDWSAKSQTEHHQRSVAFADESDSNDDNSRLIEKLETLTIKMDSQFQNLKEEMHEMRNKYHDLKDNHASKNRMNVDTPMRECHEANYILHSYQSHHDPNDSEKSLTELNSDVRNDLKKKSKPINQEPQPQTNFEKLMTKFLDGQRVTNMFFKNNVIDMIIKMKQNEKNFQTKIKNMERKIDERSKFQNVPSKQTDRTDPPSPPPQAHTEYVDAVFTGSGKSDHSSKPQKDPPPPIIVNNNIKKDKPIKTSKKGYNVVKTK
nr:hypothetical protein [Tanacetum cinerariifolium]